jgi:hydroxyacylglutathione hydrolase
MADLVITAVPCLRDNYAYLVRGATATQAWVVDPSEPEPVIAALAAAGLGLAGVLATHHHPDHVGGVPGLLAHFGARPVAAHASDRDRIEGQSVFVDAPTTGFVDSGVIIDGRRALAAHIPGHTRGAIAWYLPAEAGDDGHVFTGDTLFAGGCGRLFEGTPAQMYASLTLLCSLPETTKMWFGHEYTASNLRFAAVAEPDNDAIARRAAALPPCTTPTTVALERATNPFVRAGDAEGLGRRRAAKDEFR